MSARPAIEGVILRPFLAASGWTAAAVALADGRQVYALTLDRIAPGVAVRVQELVGGWCVLNEEDDA